MNKIRLYFAKRATKKVFEFLDALWETAMENKPKGTNEFLGIGIKGHPNKYKITQVGP